MIKAVVFDLGGTLMEYMGMPLNWEDYYYVGFQNVNRLNELNLCENEIQDAIKIVKEYNPRNCKREYEVAPEIIFRDATAGWSKIPEIEKVIEDFFAGMSLKTRIFDYSHKLIENCKKKGLFVACLTDLANGMPDYMFRKEISAIEPLFDLYVSSQTIGVRKPNSKGIEFIAESFGINISEILLVGDEKKDEDTAARAGCQFQYIDDYRNRIIIVEGKRNMI